MIFHASQIFTHFLKFSISTFHEFATCSIHHELLITIMARITWNTSCEISTSKQWHFPYHTFFYQPSPITFQKLFTLQTKTKIQQTPHCFTFLTKPKCFSFWYNLMRIDNLCMMNKWIVYQKKKLKC
jgi:hypothetical protein